MAQKSHLLEVYVSTCFRAGFWAVFLSYLIKNGPTVHKKCSQHSIARHDFRAVIQADIRASFQAKKKSIELPPRSQD